MAKGSFEGLYTFEQVASIYNIDPSTIRKQVQSNKFLEGEIKKFGKTWIMTEQAMIYHYGRKIFIAYQQQKKLKAKELKADKENILSMDVKCDDVQEFTWDEIRVNEKNVESTFTFS